MGLLARIKEAFAASSRPQFLGDDGSLVVLHDDYIERIWGRVAVQAEQSRTPHRDPSEEVGSSQRSETRSLEEASAALSPDGTVLSVVSAEFQWEVPVDPQHANAAAMFVNQINTAANGATLSLETYIHRH
jgi:hypothetical protein